MLCTLMAITLRRLAHAMRDMLEAILKVWNIPHKLMGITHTVLVHIRRACFHAVFTVWSMPCTTMATTPSRPASNTIDILQAAPTA